VRVRFLPEPAARSAEVATVAHYTRGLARDHGFEIVAGEDCDVTIATGMHGAAVLAAACESPPAAWLALDLEDRRGTAVDPGVWTSPRVQPIAATRWIADLLAAMRGAPPPLVRPGLARPPGVPPANPPVALKEPLRVVVLADDAGDADEAIRGVQGMREPRVLTVVVRDGASVGDVGAERQLSGLNDDETRAVLGRNDVLVRAIREEPLPLAALDAFAAGATCVLAPATGHDEVVTHGFDGLVTSFDDDRGTARALDLLARDRRLLAFLRENAVATARGWPSWAQASGLLALALKRIARTPC